MKNFYSKQIDVRSLSPDYYCPNGWFKVPARRSLDEFSDKYNLMRYVSYKYRGRKSEEEVRALAERVLRKRRNLIAKRRKRLAALAE